jgi:hypothetical protein
MENVEGRAEPVQLALALASVAYSGLLLIALSGAVGWWSGMHSLATFALLFLATPTMLVQGALLWRTRAASPRHRLAFGLSVGFPVALGILIATVTLSSRS